MAHDRLAVLNTIADQGLVALHSHAEANVTIRVADAIYAGGGRLLEFMNRARHAPSVFEQLRAHADSHLPDLIVGAGSVEDRATAAIFIAAGAEFIVSPTLVPEIAELCNRYKVPYLPGTMTVTEIAVAETLGVEYVKLYPAISPAFVEAVLMARPWTRIVATGDIGVDDLEAWFTAGATAVGTMSVAPPGMISRGHYAQISDLVRATLTRITEDRPPAEAPT